MCIIHEGGKKGSPTSSGSQVTQGIESSLKIEITNVKHDEFTTVHSDVQLEIPLKRVIFLN